MRIEEYTALIEKVQKEFPAEAEAELQRGARKLRREIKDASPVGHAKHPHKLKNSWKMEMTGTSAKTLEAHIYSTAPHFHLVERGHVWKTPHGKIKGYKQGTHFMEKTVNAEGPGIYDEMGRRLAEKVGVELG